MNLEPDQPQRTQLSGMAARLHSAKDEIMQRWKNCLGAEATCALTEFLPSVLDGIVDNLRTQSVAEIKQAAMNCNRDLISVNSNKNRLLAQIIREYRMLRQALFEVLEAREPVPSADRDIILDSLFQAIMAATLVFVAAADESAALTNSLLESADDCFKVLDLEGRLQMLVGPSARHSEIGFGEAYLGKSWIEFWPRLEDQRAAAEAVAVAAQGERGEFVAYFPSPSQKKWWNVVITPIFDDSGRPVKLLSVARDVTKTREAEDVSRRFIEAMPTMAFITDAAGGILYCNQRWLEFTGLSPEVARATGWRLIVHQDFAGRFITSWLESVRNGRNFEAECLLRRHDGVYRWMLARAVPMRDAEGQIVAWYGTNTEIHDQKMACEELRRERELREQFTNALTHDLRNPLSTAKMSVQLLTRVEDENTRTKLFTRLRDAIARADRMITDLLDVHRMKGGEPLPLSRKPCDLRALVAQVVEEANLTYGDRIVLLDGPPCAGLFSGEELRRVLENLINNAIKYGSAETKVTVSLETGPQFATIGVHNFGGELTTDEIKDLFEMFRRLRTADASGQRGWGIGLTLVKGIVEAHGGRIDVESGQGKGTWFRVHLPLT